MVNMSLPFSVHSATYLEHVHDFRDAALENSRWIGRRKRLGQFTYGIAHAHWQTEENGSAHLIDEGLRYKHSNLKLYPTTLRVYHPGNVNGFELTTFRMDVDDIGCIEVSRNLIVKGTMLEVARAAISNRQDRLIGLTRATGEDRELLYNEMQRGATGIYATYGHYEDE